MAEEKKEIVTSLRVDKDLWNESKIYAIENGLTMKELVTKLLKRELDRRGLVSEE